jgi:hypothetical protein
MHVRGFETLFESGREEIPPPGGTLLCRLGFNRNRGRFSRDPAHDYI